MCALFLDSFIMKGSLLGVQDRVFHPDQSIAYALGGWVYGKSSAHLFAPVHVYVEIDLVLTHDIY